MMAKTTISIAMLMSLMLVALPASAEHDERRKRDKRETHAEKIAHSLKQATHELYAEARHSSRYNWRYRYAISSLYDLERCARDFDRRVQRDGIYSYRTQRDFERLEATYHKAQYRVDRLRRSRHLRHELARVDHLMRKLEKKLARVDRHGHGYRHHARVDTHRDRWRASFAWNF